MNPASRDKKGRPGILTRQQWQAKLNWPKTLREPSMIFVNSMNDWLVSDMPDSDIRAILDTCRATPQHVYQFLTKRTGRLRRLLPQLDLPPNVWIGQSLGINKAVRGRLEAFHDGAYEAPIRFLSCEPLLEDLDWT
jgi:protein gp37